MTLVNGGDGHNLTFNVDIPYGKSVDNSITDISRRDHTITKNGNVTHSSEQTILGDSSLYFDGSSHLKVDGKDLLFDFDEDDMTIEF